MTFRQIGGEAAGERGEASRMDVEPAEPDTPRTPRTPRRTSPYLTKFEFARAVGIVALQMESHPDSSNSKPALEVAAQLILDRKPPLVFRRYLPDGTHEDCSLQSLL